MKKSLLLFLILIFIFGSFACSAKKQDENTSASVTDTTKSASADEATTPSNEENTEAVKQTVAGSDNTVPATQTADAQNPTDSASEEDDEWILVVNGMGIITDLPMYEGYEEPALPLLLIGKQFGAEVEWLTDTELSLWYGTDELYINTEYEDFCIYLPYGIDNPIREMIDGEVYIDLPSMSSAIARWGGTSVSVDKGNKIIKIY